MSEVSPVSSPGGVVGGKLKKKLKKKEKRKEKRVQEALERKTSEDIPDPTVQVNEELQQQQLEAQIQQLQLQQHKLWEEQEHEAQIKWVQDKLDKERQEIERREEAERKRIEREALIEKRRREREELAAKEAANPTKKPDETYGTEKDSYNCSFFLKTGVCRYGESCGKRHPYPEMAETLVFRNMYEGLGLAEVLDENADEDLQYDESEIKKHFEDFYFDIVPEFQKFGEIVVLQVCRNYAQHLRGNVYIQFKEVESAVTCLNTLSGRYYATRQLKPLFVPITKWKTAICGLYDRRRCPKGKECNFLHVFHNPDGLYEEDIHARPGDKPQNQFNPNRNRDMRDNDRYRRPPERRDWQRDGDRGRERDYRDGERFRDDRDRERDRPRESGRDTRERDSRDTRDSRGDRRRERSRSREREHHKRSHEDPERRSRDGRDRERKGHSEEHHRERDSHYREHRGNYPEGPRDHYDNPYMESGHDHERKRTRYEPAIAFQPQQQPYYN